jgi:hypothetical protein
VKYNIKALSQAVAANFGLLAPLLVVTAVVCVGLAAGSVKTAAASVRVQQDKSNVHVSLEKAPITNAEAMEMARRLGKLAPSTTIGVSGHYLVVSIASKEQFAEWVHALTEVQSLQTDVVWASVKVCINSCEGGESAKAFVNGYRQHLRVD